MVRIGSLAMLRDWTFAFERFSPLPAVERSDFVEDVALHTSDMRIEAYRPTSRRSAAMMSGWYGPRRTKPSTVGRISAQMSGVASSGTVWPLL